MTSLERLGIKCEYRTEGMRELNYTIPLNPEKFNSPKEERDYFQKMIRGISRDVSKKKGLENLTLTFDSSHRDGLISTTQELIDEAEKQKLIRKGEGDFPILPRILIIGGATAGTVAGLVYGYDQMSEWGTNAANSMNNYSHLLAPIAGSLQAGISIFGSAATTLVGCLAGLFGGVIASRPYVFAKTPLASEVENFKRIKEELSSSKI